MADGTITHVLQENDAPVDDIEDVVLSTKDEKKRAEHWKKLDKLHGFKKYRRQTDPYRDPVKRVKDWNEINRRQKVCGGEDQKLWPSAQEGSKEWAVR